MIIYAYEDDGTRHMVAIECDLCDARIKPHPKISESGWITRGLYWGPGDSRNTQWALCPEHAGGDPR